MRRDKSRLVHGPALLIALFTALLAPARAALVDLDLYVTFSILQDNGTAPLVDGSWVAVFGSSDAVNNGLQTYPAGSTNYQATSTIGDDLFIGYVFIGDNTFANTGKFFKTFQYDTTNNIGYVYIRYFQTTGPLTGMIHWGQSGVYNLSPTNFGTVTVDVAPLQSLVATNYNNFVVIPEPSTAGLFLVAGAVLLAVRRTRGRANGRAKPGGPGRKE